MNTMARAHALTVKRRNAKLLNGITPAAYRVVFAIALRDAHKEAKEMSPLVKHQIAQFEKRINELEGQLPAISDKWIVTIGGLPLDFGQTSVKPWANLESATKWNSPAFARANASKVTNGLGEKGKAIRVFDYVVDEVLELKRLIKALQAQ